MTLEETREKVVSEHYHVEDLTNRILGVLEQAGKQRNAITVADLAPVDEFHIGGREATEAIAARMGLRPGMRLLDVGSGIGGPARYFASAHDCKVSGIDLTPEYVRTATTLSKLVGLSEKVNFQEGSALKMPFGNKEFDGAYEFHAAMNIAEKRELFAEVRRVLKPHAIFAIYDVMLTGPGEMKFPVPWASKEMNSFVATPEEYRSALKEEGFEVVEERERREFAIEFFERMKKKAEEKDARTLTIHLVMGETAPQKLANLVEAVQKGVIAPVEIIAKKSGAA